MSDELAQFGARCGVPGAGCAVGAAGHDCCTVRTEPDRIDRAGVTDEIAQHGAGGGIPDTCRAVAATGDDHRAVRAERRTVDRAGVT